MKWNIISKTFLQKHAQRVYSQKVCIHWCDHSHTLVKVPVKLIIYLYIYIYRLSIYYYYYYFTLYSKVYMISAYDYTK